MTKSRKRRHVDAFDARILDNSALATGALATGALTTASYAVGPSATERRFITSKEEDVSKSEISPGDCPYELLPCEKSLNSSCFRVFLDASTHLYKRVGPSVHPSVFKP